MVMHAECVLYTVSNSQSVNNRHANKQIVKGLVHLKMKIIPCFTHPQSILGVHDFLLSDESNQIYIKMILALSRVRMEVGGCFCSTVQK